MDIILRQKLSLLIDLAKVDGHFASEERDLITQLAYSKGLTKKEIEDLIERPDKIESLGALSKARKKEYLVDSIRLMLADGKIEDTERNFCRNIAVKLRYQENIVDFLINHWSSDVESLDLEDFELANF